MARQRKPSAEPRTTTALVPTQVTVGGGDDASDDERTVVVQGIKAIIAHGKVLEETNRSLVAQIVARDQDMILHFKVMADAHREAMNQLVINAKLQSEMLDGKAERKLRLERQKSDDELKALAGREILSMLPLVTKKFFNAPAVTEKEATTLVPFVAALDRDELAGMLGALKSPAKRAHFEAILKALPDYPDGDIRPVRVEEDEDEKPAAAEAPKSNGAH